MTKRKRPTDDFLTSSPANKAWTFPRNKPRTKSENCDSGSSNSSSMRGGNNDSRNMVKELTNAIIPQLDARAEHYGLLSDFALGIRDAQWIIEACPTLATGYLRLGSLYLMQGKSALAVATYDRGLTQVVPYTTQLAMARAAAVKQLVIWIDPVVKLPYDLLRIVFKHLSMDDRVESARVSRRWRTCLVGQFGELWKDVTLGTEKMESLLPLIGRHIRSLDIHRIPSERAQLVWNLIKSDQFIELRSLTLDVNRLTTVTLVHRMPNITFLKIHHSTVSTYAFMESLLASCPNLSWLSLTNSIKMPSRKWSRLPRILKLQSLSVHIRKTAVLYKDIEPILRRSPDLRQLFLHPCNDPDLMHGVGKWCPRLETVELNTLGTATKAIPVKTFNNDDDNDGGSYGLKRLAVVTWKKPLELDPCILRPTLTSLYIDLNGNDPAPGTISALLGFNSSKIAELELGGFHGEVVHLLLAQSSARRRDSNSGDMTKVASLTRLRLLSTMLTGNFFTTAIRHYPANHLVSLVLQDCDALERTNQLSKLLKHSQQSLERVVLERMINVSDTVLDVIVSLSRLRELVLDSCVVFSYTAMNLFGRKVKQLPRLEMVELHNLTGITDETLQGLAEVPRLRELGISNADNITDSGMELLLNKTSKQLESLIVSSCYQLTDAMLERIDTLFPLSSSSVISLL